VTLLPKLFQGCAITTNFDRALETVYANESKAFTEKVMGRGQAGTFLRAIPGGDRYLLKLHGNLDNAADRILSKAEYDAAYGNDGDIQFSLTPTQAPEAPIHQLHLLVPWLQPQHRPHDPDISEGGAG
jgi:hypothetical protein